MKPFFTFTEKSVISEYVSHFNNNNNNNNNNNKLISNELFNMK